MNIGSIDRSAVSDLGWLHRLSPVAKLVAFALTLSAVIVTWNLFFVLAIGLALFAAAASGGLDLKLLMGLASYPAVFALIFAIASAPNALVGSVIVLKAVCAGMAAVTLVLTTPYPQVFAPVQRVVPGIVGDAMLMTYRTSFLLLDKFSSLLRAARLRAGVRGTHPVRSARIATQSLGSLLLYGFDLAQRDFDILQLRGYSGHLRVHLPRSANPLADGVLLAFCVLTLAFSVVWRTNAAALNPYSWLLPIPALAAVALGFVVRWRNR